MAKIKAPKTKPEAPDTEAPAPDLSALREAIVETGKAYFDAEDAANSTVTDMVIRIREEREEQPTVERESIKIVIQEAVAEIRGLKLEHVQSAPAKTLKQSKPEEYAKRNSSYVLVSQLLSMSWPKGETEDKKVAKAIEEGETGFVKLRKLSAKPTKASNRKENSNKITADNFVEKLKAFLTKCATDTGDSLEEVLDKAEMEAIPAIRAELEAPAKD